MLIPKDARTSREHGGVGAAHPAAPPSPPWGPNPAAGMEPGAPPPGVCVGRVLGSGVSRAAFGRGSL